MPELERSASSSTTKPLAPIENQHPEDAERFLVLARIAAETSAIEMAESPEDYTHIVQVIITAMHQTFPEIQWLPKEDAKETEITR
jgi:hypothetical protein